MMRLSARLSTLPGCGGPDGAGTRTLSVRGPMSVAAIRRLLGGSACTTAVP